VASLYGKSIKTTTSIPLDMKKICVFCGSSYGNKPHYSEAVKTLSELFIQYKIELVYGGAKVGLMGELADQIIRSGGEVTGIIPRFLKEQEVEHNGITRLIEVDSMHERKEMMEKESDGFIALPGGVGTIEEIFEMITWGQLSLHEKPCAFLNVNGFYDLIDAFLENTVKEGFLDQDFKNMILVESDPEIVIQWFLNYKHHTIDKAERARSSFSLWQTRGLD
jgi:uncharacterized protein (TIGR00730 family)